MNDVKQKKVNAMLAQRILATSGTKVHASRPDLKTGCAVSIKSFSLPKKSTTN